MKRISLKQSFKKCRKENLFVTALLFLTILIGAGYVIFAPKETFSEEENRSLTEFPSMKWEDVVDGSYTSDLDSFVGDHFMLRRELIALNTQVQLAVGRRDIGSNYAETPAQGGVYFGSNDHIYEVLLPNRDNIFKNNVTALVNFGEKTGLPFYFMPVPSGSQEQQENLPAYAPSHDQTEERDYIRQKLGDKGKLVNLFDRLSSSTGNDYYYRTDHHWTAYGAYEGYSALMESMNITPTPQEEFEFRAVEQPFYGTLYSKAITFSQKPDTMYLPYLKDGQNLVQKTGKSTRDGIYWEEYLQKKDKYSAFLGGNHSVDVVQNPDVANGKKILLVKDSFANSMVPYLTTNFSEVHIIDPRYYNQNIYEYIRENGITEVAVVYSIKQMSEINIANKLRGQ